MTDTEKTGAEKIHKIASDAVGECKGDWFELLDKLQEEIAMGLAGEDMEIVNSRGVSSGFVIAREAALNWLFIESVEGCLKSEFKLIKELRGYPK